MDPPAHTPPYDEEAAEAKKAEAAAKAAAAGIEKERIVEGSVTLEGYSGEEVAAATASIQQALASVSKVDTEFVFVYSSIAALAGMVHSLTPRFKPTPPSLHDRTVHLCHPAPSCTTPRCLNRRVNR